MTGKDNTAPATGQGAPSDGAGGSDQDKDTLAPKGPVAANLGGGNGPNPVAGQPAGQSGKAGTAAQGGGRQGPGAQAAGQRGPGPQGQGPRQGRPQGQGQGQGQGPGKMTPPPPPVVEIRPIAEGARMRRRHWGLLLSFVLMVLAPLAVSAYYLWFVSADEYASTAGFTVRKEEGSVASDLLGGLAKFAGGTSSAADTDVLYEFIQSQELVERIDDELDIVGHYSAHWSDDPVFSLWPDATIEDLLWYWRRVVRVSFNQSTGLIELRVLAFEPEYAQKVAQAIMAASQDKINELNAAARADLMKYAQADLEEALTRLKSAREALTKFRTQTQIVDPTADIQSQLGVLNGLQQQLAQALIEYDLVVESTASNDPRVVQLQRRIDAIRERIRDERESFASAKVSGVGEDYPTLMAEYESLTVDREYAEETYRAALASLDVARANSSRQTRYLAAYVRPTLAQSSEYPQRGILIGLAALFLTLAWAVVALVYYSIRDRR